MKLRDIAETSRLVAAESSRLGKIALLSGCLSRLAEEEIEPAFAWLSGEIAQGRIGLGYAAAREARPASAASEAALTVREVHEGLERLAATGGKGAQGRRMAELRGLLERATPQEQDFLLRLLLGGLRQGAQEGVMVEALARAAGVAADPVRRACMLAGQARAVARAVLTRGEAGLADFRLRLLSPLQPMLAQSAAGTQEVLAGGGAAAFEYKLDGARVQVHKLGDEVRVFTRSLHEVSAAVPELVEQVRGYGASRLALDGEALVIQPDGRPAPFQVSMRRFGRRSDVEALRLQMPLSLFLFDCLHLEGRDLIDLPARERFEALAEAAPAAAVVPRLITASPQQAEEFLRGAVAAGHEGLMAKSLEAPYEAGRRGEGWLKLKLYHTLDLIVLAAEWGSGRRRGWLSNLHLGARDPATPGGTVMLGKTFKGMTDSMLEWQTRRLMELRVADEGGTVLVRPELVVEVSFDGVQASPHYPGGVALRFARIKRYRPEKRAREADTIEAVRAIARLGGSLKG